MRWLAKALLQKGVSALPVAVGLFYKPARISGRVRRGHVIARDWKAGLTPSAVYMDGCCVSGLHVRGVLARALNQRRRLDASTLQNQGIHRF
jgi:hypothetical protein